MELIETKCWRDYELLDTGKSQKLERFGPYVLVRPEPKAIWDKHLSDEEWEGKSQAVFRRTYNSSRNYKEESGEWYKKKDMPDQWVIEFPMDHFYLKMRLGLTPFRHVGIFPEQATNWEYIYETISMMKIDKPKVLNLFAYTGAASIVALAAGAEVVHVEALKQLITWTNENMTLNQLSGIRWMLEDVVKFVKREIRRGHKYHGIIMDPPAYGRGTEGEKWILEEGINDLLKDARQLMFSQNRFFVLNLYAKGISPLITENLFDDIFGEVKGKECGELFIQDHYGRRLPYGSLLRFREIG